MDFAFLAAEWLGKPVWMWAGFLLVVLVLMVLDLGILHRRSREIGVRESLVMSAGYIAVALLFGIWVWHSLGSETAVAYVTGFLVEKTLAIDNIFVITLIFSFFAIPRELQHRVLLWGIVGVVVLRAIMIGLGATLVAQFSWVLYFFAAFLIATGVKMLLSKGEPTSLDQNRLVQFLRRRLRVTQELHGDRFVVRQPDPRTGRLAWAITPLFLALLLIEAADLVFAVDSVPAIFAITTDPYVVYTSNIFAVMGLRALYFALAAVLHRFAYLKPALAVVLVFVGSKIFVADLLGLEKFPPVLSLAITLGILAAGVAYSLWKTRRTGAAAPGLSAEQPG